MDLTFEGRPRAGPSRPGTSNCVLDDVLEAKNVRRNPPLPSTVRLRLIY